jgi:transposase InsO family protein
VRERIIDLALNRPELSPRELAVTFTDTEGYFVSESSVYRLLKAHDLITSPAFIVIKAADEFHDKTTAPNQLWQTDFTYLKVIGWGWFYLSTILDDFSRYIIAWKLCTTMRVEDVTDTLAMALEASGCDSAKVVQRPRLLSDNGPCYVAGDLADWLSDQNIEHTRGAPSHPQTQGKIERWHQTLKNPSYSKTTSCLAISKPRSRPSSSTIITSATTRAWAISPRPTSTSGAAKQSSWKEKGSNERPSNSGACSIAKPQPKMQTEMRQSLR